jgi:transient receptor potential cation channel subfamily M protein 3
VRIALFLLYRSQALIGSDHGSAVPKATIVHENGKVLTDNDDGNHRAYGILSEYYDSKSSRPLRLKKKLYEFYTAPITKFWANAVSSDCFYFISS